ncbi:MAG: hypothetical protein HY927_09705 [Elusimicrobia bacterium]|nr:hypothetical protein [Elusimicrobiota bacterium]
MDPSDLWREDVFTDRKVGTIRRLTPVKPDGSPDALRKTVYVGEAQLMTSVGSLPLNFEIPAATLDEAVARYGDAVQEAFTHAMDELQEMRRKASSGLVIPQAGSSLGDIMPGKLPGGKLKL